MNEMIDTYRLWRPFWDAGGVVQEYFQLGNKKWDNSMQEYLDGHDRPRGLQTVGD